MRFLILIFVFNFWVYSFAQNLVPNYSFEYFTSCPDAVAQVYKAYPWIDPTGSTPDYLNACNTSGLGVPSHFGNGFQNALTGSGYVHSGVYSSNTEFRDYIQTPISISIQGYYCFSFFINFSNTSDFSIDKIGGFISNTSVTCSPPGCVINVNPQIESGQLYDTLNWVRINGIVYLNGDENTLTIGCFRYDTELNVQRMQDHPLYESSSIYVEDVILTLIRPPVLPDSIATYSGESIMIGDTAQDAAQYFWSPVDGLTDPNSFQTLAVPSTTTTYTLTKITACDTTESKIKVEVLANENNITVMPNPNNNSFQVKYNLTENANFVIYDALGRKIYQTNLMAGSNIIYEPTINLSSALYFLTLETNEKRLFQTKVVVGE